tara:strand:- start:282 stop:1157 length:876 start_codon:yes stop_codon:yes gene_type:complete
MFKIKYLIQLLRPNNWIKNLIIFSPIFFSGKMNDVILLKQCWFAFISFSFLASSIYIINDYIDIEQDRIHPLKKDRPLASGRVSIAYAGPLAISLLILGIGLILILFSKSTFYFSISYVVIMVTYCYLFRQKAIIDIGIIAFGFVLRLYVGSSVTGIPNSMWIIIMTFLLALFIALAKRRDDLINPVINDMEVRESLKGYNLRLVDSLIIVLVPIIIVSYMLYCTAEENITRIGENLYLTSVFVLFGFVRYLQIVFVKNLGGDPVQILYEDSTLKAIVVAWMATFGYLLYL